MPAAELIVAPIVASELATGAHRTAITLEEEPVSVGTPVQLRERSGPTFATAVPELRLSVTIDAIQRRLVEREFGSDAYPSLEDPEDLLTRIPADIDRIDEPRLADLHESQLRFYRLNEVQPITSDNQLLGDDERQAIKADPVLEIEDVIAHRKGGESA